MRLICLRAQSPRIPLTPTPTQEIPEPPSVDSLRRSPLLYPVASMQKAGSGKSVKAGSLSTANKQPGRPGSDKRHLGGAEKGKQKGKRKRKQTQTKQEQAAQAALPVSRL